MKICFALLLLLSGFFQNMPALAAKERLVLMPLRVADADISRQAAMETALVQGLQQKYEVFSGEQVAKKTRDIFNKESRNLAKKECDETRCMQGIAESFQAELIATANVSKQDDGYFLALSIRNIFDNKVVYSNAIPCKNCDAYQVVEKLKQLSSSLVAKPADVAPDNSADIQRAQFAQILMLMMPFKINMQQYYQTEGDWPSTWNQLGINPQDTGDANYLEKIQLETGGEMRAILSKKFGEKKYISLRPKIIMGGMNMSWLCKTNLPKTVAPINMDCEITP